jgi:hypothetical protein
MSHYYYIHRHKVTGKFLNAPHVGHRLFYDAKSAREYFDSPEYHLETVTLELAHLTTMFRGAVRAVLDAADDIQCDDPPPDSLLEAIHNLAGVWDMIKEWKYTEKGKAK